MFYNYVKSPARPEPDPGPKRSSAGRALKIWARATPSCGASVLAKSRDTLFSRRRCLDFQTLVQV